tara:strand:+ start:174 stop:536 length:363 start_codon:yes stop_codon:yes gene_type:complete
MKLTDDTIKTLSEEGVPLEDIENTILIHIPFQAGSAFTLPLFGRNFIFPKRYIRDDQWLHEFCHVAQINRMGGRKYWKRVVIGRFHPGSGGLLGKNLEEEKECYGIQAAYRTRNMKGKKR